MNEMPRMTNFELANKFQPGNNWAILTALAGNFAVWALVICLYLWVTASAHAHGKIVVIESYLYAPDVIKSIEFQPILGHGWPWRVELRVAGWLPPNGTVHSQPVMMPYDAPCFRFLKFTFARHVPVTFKTPMNVCPGGPSVIELKQASPAGGPTAPLKIEFE